ANGRIVDGSGNPWYYGDLAIRGDRIVQIGRHLEVKAKRKIDARGLVVAPGFIDMMGQSEYYVLVDPRVESKVFQGITTEVTGEGGSVAPLSDYQLKESADFIKHFKLNVDWRMLRQYFVRLEGSPPAINLATFVGTSQVREYVMKSDNRAPTAAELEQM